MDGRDSAKCQNSRKKGHMSFWKFLNEEKTKRNSCLLHLKRRKTKRAGKRCSELSFHFLKRESTFSLDFRAIRPSKFFGARRKVVLRDEATRGLQFWEFSTNSVR